MAEQQAPRLCRTDLQRQDLSVPGREVIQSRGGIGPEAPLVNHAHPGEATSYILEGPPEYQIEGQPPKTFNAGEALTVPPGGSRGPECRQRQRGGTRHRPPNGWFACLHHLPAAASRERLIGRDPPGQYTISRNVISPGSRRRAHRRRYGRQPVGRHRRVRHTELGFCIGMLLAEAGVAYRSTPERIFTGRVLRDAYGRAWPSRRNVPASGFLHRPRFRLAARMS